MGLFNKNSNVSDNQKEIMKRFKEEKKQRKEAERQLRKEDHQKSYKKYSSRSFSKKPTGMDAYYIQSGIDRAKTLYKQMFETDRVDHYLSFRDELNCTINKLLEYEHIYPNVFKAPHRPSDVCAQIQNEQKECEHKLIDRNIIRIERLLLNYKTERGKRNNFVKETDIIKYYAGEFLPETIDYFLDQLQQRFPNYV